MRIKHEVLKDEKGKIIGIGLLPDGESWGERFCNLFPKALVEGKAEIRVEGKKLVFDLKSDRQQFIVKPKEADFPGLKKIFAPGVKMVVNPFCPPEWLGDVGFKVTLRK